MTRDNGRKSKKAKIADTPYSIPCRIEPGMFRQEYLVYLDAIDPDDPKKKVAAQLLVDERDVFDIHGTPRRNNPASAKLRVALVASHGEVANVILPQPSQPLGESILVAAESVRKAPTYGSV